MARRLTRRIFGTVTASVAIAMAVVMPRFSASANDAVPSPEVEAAFSCSAAGSVWLEGLCAQGVHFSAPRPVHLMSQAYIDGRSGDPVGDIDHWIAAAYDENGGLLGTVSAQPTGDEWQFSSLDTRESFTTDIARHPAADLVELRMTGGAFFAVETGTILGLNEPARMIAATPRSVADAQRDIASAYDRSSGGGGALPGSSAGVAPVVGFSIFAAVVIGAFGLLAMRSDRSAKPTFRPQD